MIKDCSCGQKIIRFKFRGGHQWVHLNEVGIPVVSSMACIDPDDPEPEQ